MFQRIFPRNLNSTNVRAWKTRLKPLVFKNVWKLTSSNLHGRPPCFRAKTRPCCTKLSQSASFRPTFVWSGAKLQHVTLCSSLRTANYSISLAHLLTPRKSLQRRRRIWQWFMCTIFQFMYATLKLTRPTRRRRTSCCRMSAFWDHGENFNRIFMAL